MKISSNQEDENYFFKIQKGRNCSQKISWLISALLILFFHSALAADKLTVMLDWFANPNHAPLFVAKEQGFFKKQGLNVIFIGPADPTDPPKLVAAGKIDIALTYQPKLLLQVTQGLPLVRIATLIDSPLSCLVVLKDSPIKNLADFKGKTIGYSDPAFDTVSLNVILKKARLSLDKVKPIDVHFNLTQSLLSRQVDAVTGMMRNFELIELKLMGQPGLAFYPEKYGVPPYDELIFVINKKEEHDPRIPKFLKALQEGVIYLKKHPLISWQLFIKDHPELNDAVNKAAWFATLNYFPNNPATLNSYKYNNFAMFMHKERIIPRVPTLGEYTFVFPL